MWLNAAKSRRFLLALSQSIQATDTWPTSSHPRPYGAAQTGPFVLFAMQRGGATARISTARSHAAVFDSENETSARGELRRSEKHGRGVI